MRTSMILCAAAIALLFGCVSRARQESQLQEGGYYSAKGGKGSFVVFKVIKLEPGIVHLRLYKNHYVTRPKAVDISSLTLGTIHDADGCGVGHLPIKAASVQVWEPQFLCSSPVTDEELEGYNIWKESADGKVWD